VITLDFETEGIEGNPLVSPPKPVGLAVYYEDANPLYITDWHHMKTIWLESLDSDSDLLFHNAPFDLAVGLHWFGGEPPHWERVHDTIFILFQVDPYSRTLSLKPSADLYLDLPPQEETELHTWILNNVPEATPKTAGAYICRAPGEMVAPYAKGDVLRTRLLYDKFVGDISREAYDRERRLAPRLREATVRGVPLDVGRLELDYENCSQSLTRCDELIFERLGGEFNLNSGQQLADKMDKAGLVDQWIMTAPSKTYPEGQRSTSKDNLIKVCKDKDLVNLLSYRSVMNTCVNTFMGPWLEFSREDGRVHPEWNQVANDEGNTHKGARTGRLSSSKPNFQNPPNPFGVSTPDGLHPVPVMRSYILPEEGHVWVKRDFSSQELRILGHYEDGPLMVAYREDPFLDPHNMARDLIHRMTGQLHERSHVKMTSFGIIYGMGAPGLAQSLSIQLDEAKALRSAYFKAMPAAANLAASTRHRGQSGQGVRTWGGRLYLSEPAKVIRGKMRSFEYKLLNYLIQGSAGDQTKQVICDWCDQVEGSDCYLMSSIHDEINISVPEEDWRYEMERLKLCMDQDLFDVPMRSEGFYGPNWGDLKLLPKEEDYDL
jgi:DNA polymerase I-like protein with 3'-5' exonuclease and polymerase domains